MRVFFLLFFEASRASEREREKEDLFFASLPPSFFFALSPSSPATILAFSQRLQREQKERSKAKRNEKKDAHRAVSSLPFLRPSFLFFFFFSLSLRRFSVPEELFGPLSMRGLENDEYVRQTNGYLPTSEVAFIDEIFKANSAILNALLTLLNERLFDNGHARLKVPLLTLIAASNELPESEELDALYDRFLVRRHVSQVSTQALGRLALLAAGQSDGSESSEANAEASSKVDELAFDDFKNAAAEAYAAVTLPESVIDLLVGLRTHLQDRCEPPVSVRFFVSIFTL